MLGCVEVGGWNIVRGREGGGRNGCWVVGCERVNGVNRVGLGKEYAINESVVVV